MNLIPIIVIFMKRILVLFVLVSTFLFVCNRGISHAYEPISFIDAEILLSKIKADRETVVQSNFEQLFKQYSDIEPPEDPAITAYMAACVAEKINAQNCQTDFCIFLLIFMFTMKIIFA